MNVLMAVAVALTYVVGFSLPFVGYAIHLRHKGKRFPWLTFWACALGVNLVAGLIVISSGVVS